jgi:hypothetical protein
MSCGRAHRAGERARHSQEPGIPSRRARGAAVGGRLAEPPWRGRAAEAGYDDHVAEGDAKLPFPDGSSTSSCFVRPHVAPIRADANGRTVTPGRRIAIRRGRRGWRRADVQGQ